MSISCVSTRSEANIQISRLTKSISRLLVVIGIYFLAGMAGAQELPDAPTTAKNPPTYVGAYGDYLYRSGVTCGAGASTYMEATKPTLQCGGLISMAFMDFETGVMGPQSNRNSVSGYLSTNIWVPLIPFKQWGNRHGLPLVVGGYTRMFETGHALDYGVAFARPIDGTHSIQFEARDYWAFSNPSQHNVIFRVVWLTGLPD